MPRTESVDLPAALHGVDFPCGKQQLISHAESHHAGDLVIEELKALPDLQYNSMADVLLRGMWTGATRRH